MLDYFGVSIIHKTDRKYRIFNVAYVIFSHLGGPQFTLTLIWRTFCSLQRIWPWRNLVAGAKPSIHVTFIHPCGDHADCAWLSFWEWVLPLCDTDSPQHCPNQFLTPCSTRTRQKSVSVLFYVSSQQGNIRHTKQQQKTNKKTSIYLYVLLTVIKLDKTSTLDSCRSQIFFKSLISECTLPRSEAEAPILALFKLGLKKCAFYKSWKNLFCNCSPSCMCMHMYECAHMHTHTHTHTCIHAHKHIHYCHF